MIRVFNFISADGFFAGPNGEIDWFKFVDQDDEFYEITHESAKGESSIIMGRITYDMMKSYWPTELAINTDPDMAEVMNNSQKIVFSKSLKALELPNWKNIKVMHDIKPEEIKKLKGDYTILGSGSIVQQLSSLDLIDEYTLIIVPVILGDGKRMFKDEKRLKLIESKAFNNGIVILKYRALNS